jgi:MoaA/NifB/PqqE/SkfB family radical SAM enzyme
MNALVIDATPRLVELEITKACQLTCTHCLSESHPGAGHGQMALADWKRAIDSAAELGAETIQLIGGEPTVSPYWAELLEYTLDRGLGVQVYSNLYSITDRAWELLARDGVTLGTSYYSDDPAEHDQITGKAGSHARTRASIIKALELGIPIQIGIVRIVPGQRADEARAEMLALGVLEELVKIDRVRGVGRANPIEGAATPVRELCGRCGDGRLAILPDGTVAPCVLGRGLSAGNLLQKGATLRGILAGPAWEQHMRAIPRTANADPCTPDDSNDCDPARTEACRPAYNHAPPFPTIRLTPISED